MAKEAYFLTFCVLWVRQNMPRFLRLCHSVPRHAMLYNSVCIAISVQNVFQFVNHKLTIRTTKCGPSHPILHPKAICEPQIDHQNHKPFFSQSHPLFTPLGRWVCCRTAAWELSSVGWQQFFFKIESYNMCVCSVGWLRGSCGLTCCVQLHVPRLVVFSI